jgi:hypothetical protein
MVDDVLESSATARMLSVAGATRGGLDCARSNADSVGVKEETT